MTLPHVRQHLASRIRLLAALRWAWVGLVALCGALLGLGLGQMVGAGSWIVIVGAAFGALVSVGWIRPWQPVQPAYLRYLNRRYPSLQDSSHLLLANPEELPVVQQLQQQRVIAAYAAIASPILPLGRSLRRGGWVLLGMTFVAAIGLGLAAWLHPASTPDPADNLPQVAPLRKAISLVIVPPSYTGQPREQRQDLDGEVLAGSTVRWVVPQGAAVPVRLVLGEREVPFKPQSDGNMVAEAQVTEAVVYRLSYSGATDELHALTVRPDQPPGLRLRQPESFRELYWGEGLVVNLDAMAEDDYGLSRAELVLTRSIGSGEGVKFEQTVVPLPLRPVQQAGARIPQARLAHRIDLLRLGLVPGAELYGRLQVWDNRRPTAQASASETFLLVVADTATEALLDDFGLQVQIKPAYFRSQRQIILDIEKLISDSSGLAKPPFLTRSNNIAVDQKLLRLRYGQFLGEEFESAISGTMPMPTPAKPKDDAAHDHDHEGHDHDGHDHEGHDHADDHEGHDHGSAANDATVFGQGMDLSAFVHAHDSEEGATFFPEAVKVQLKAALAAMWDSELHLRVGTPSRALPHAYRALRLLKDVQQKSRVYVRRLGFSLPPLQPDKRLTGDLSKVADRQLPAPTPSELTTQADALAAWRLLLTRAPGPLQLSERVVLSRLSPLLTAQLAERPVAAVQALRVLSTWLAQPDCTPCAAGLVDALAPLLPPPPPGPVQVPASRQDPWAKAYDQSIRSR